MRRLQKATRMSLLLYTIVVCDKRGRTNSNHHKMENKKYEE